jgi:4-hydroxybenzoate polyprenyltransferase
VYCVAAAAAGGVTLTALVSAAALVSYVSGLTVVAKLAGSRARWLVPVLIAGISLLDAAVIAIASWSYALALLAALGFPLTLALQRVVPGD